MAEPHDLTTIMARAGDVYTMFIALMEQGFERPEALMLVNSMILAGATRRPPAE